MHLWVTRIAWLALPAANAGAIGAATDGWADGPRAVALALLWAGWGAGLVALLAPRPTGLTTIRTVAPTFAVLALVAGATGDASTVDAALAATLTVLCAVLVAVPALGLAAAAGIAYGEELRHPLRTPPALSLVLVPCARAIAVVGAAAGPLLLADGRVAAGVATAAIGFPASWFAVRSLHTLSRRWLILVPAGVVILDPMTLADPVLFVRRSVRSMRAVGGTVPVPDGALDLRLGASAGTVVITSDGSVDLMRLAGRRREGETLRPDQILVAITAPGRLLDEASRRRVPVELA